MLASWDDDEDDAVMAMQSVELVNTSSHSSRKVSIPANQSRRADETSSRQMLPPATDRTEPAVSVGPSTTDIAAYRIGYEVKYTGRRKSESKRVVTWRFALGRGGRGVENGRGVEHEVQLVWSTHSGRYSVHVDGNEIKAVRAKGYSILDYEWRWNFWLGKLCHDDDEGVAKMRVVACRKAPNRSGPNFRCHELLIGGKSYFELPGGESDDFDNETTNGTTHIGNVGAVSILDIICPDWRGDGFT